MYLLALLFVDPFIATEAQLDKIEQFMNALISHFRYDNKQIGNFKICFYPARTAQLVAR